MQFTKLTWQLLAILGVCVAAFVYLQNEDAIKGTTTQVTPKIKPEAFFENSEIVIYDDKGRAEFILKSQTGLYFQDQSEAIIEKPSISFLNTQSLNATYSTLRADKALYKTSDETLALKGNVEANIKSDTSKPILLKTESLKLDKNSRFISTNRAVTITHEGHHLTSIGLQASLDDKTIKLLSKVRGHYEAISTN